MKRRFSISALARELGLPAKQSRAKLRRRGFHKPYDRKMRSKYKAVLLGNDKLRVQYAGA